MNKTGKRFSIQWRFTGTLFLCVAVLGGTVVFLVNHAMKSHALEEARSKARILLDRNLATHTYFTKMLKPAVFDLAKARISKGYFDPTWMSSTFAVRKIDHIFQTLTNADYYYKKCAVNARSPENEADEFERSFLKEVNTHPDLVERSLVRKVNGKPYWVVLRRGEVMEPACLRCHGDPHRAPAGLVQRYGPKRSFHRKVGTVVSALSVRIPLAAAFAGADRFSWYLSLALLSLLLAFLFFQVGCSRHWIFGPLVRVREKAQAIARDHRRLGETIDLPSSKELGDLTHAFNTLSVELRNQMMRMEEQVKERTAFLRTTVARLRHEIAIRSQLEQVLKESSERFRLLFDKAPIPYHSLDEERRIIEANEAWLDLFGITSREAVGKKFEELLDPPEREAFRHAFDRFKREGSMAGAEYRALRKDGSTLLISLDGTAVYDETGAFLRSHCITRDVTRSRQAEEALRKRERYYRSILANLHEAILVVDSSYVITDANNAFLKGMEMSREEVVGQRCHALKYGRSDPCFLYGDRCVVAEVIRTGRPASVLHSYDRRDGGKIWLDVRGSPLKEGEESVTHTILAFRDVTDLVEAKRRLERTSREVDTLNRVAHVLLTTGTPEMYPLVLDVVQTALNSPEGVFGFVNRQGDLVCPSLARRCIWEECRVEGKRTVFPRTMWGGIWGRVLTGKKSECLNMPGKTPAGHIPVKRALCVPILHGGESIGLFVVANKETPYDEEDRHLLESVAAYVAPILHSRLRQEESEAERKRVEEEQARLVAAVEHAAECVMITDKEGVIRYVNPAFTTITGYTREEAVGRKPNLLKSGRQDADFYRKLWSTILDGRVWQGRFTNRKKDGTLYEEEATISPIYDAEGRITSFVAVKRDVTQELQLRRQLRQAQKMESIGTLAGGIAHDFNNILSAILGYTELAVYDLPPESDIRPHLEEVLEAGKRARDLVRQILTFSRGIEQEPVPVCMSSVVKEALKLLRSSLPSTIEIRERIETTGKVMADPTQIHQVLMNLCTNAYHAMRESGGILEVTLSEVALDPRDAAEFHGLSPGTYLCLSVSDTGEGIPAEYIERIFEPYFTTKKAGEGTGLGLAVVHGIVTTWKGAITVRSVPGSTTFRVYLPSVEKEEPSPQKESLEALPAGNERILFVDDEPALVRLWTRTLEQLGYQVTGCTDSREALERFRADPDGFDVVVTDMTMPHLRGDELARRLLALREKLPIVLCTGYSELITEAKANALGIRVFLLKPVSKREMAQSIRRALG